MQKKKVGNVTFIFFLHNIHIVEKERNVMCDGYEQHEYEHAVKYAFKNG